MKLIALLSIIFFLNLVHAQDIQWGEPVKFDYRQKRYFDDNGGCFIIEDDKLEYYKDNNPEPSNTSEIEYKPEDGYGVANRAYLIFNDQFIRVITTSRKGKTRTLFQVYDSNCKMVGSTVTVGENDAVEGVISFNISRVLKSENGNFFCIEYSLPLSDRENPTIGYKIYNLELEIVDEGVANLPYSMKKSVIFGDHLSNNGELFFGLKMFEDKNGGRKEGRVASRNVLTDYDKFIVYYVKGSNIEGFDLNEMGAELANKSITGICYSAIEDNKLTITGIYLEYPVVTAGIFNVKIDLENSKIISQNYEKLKSEILSESKDDYLKDDASVYSLKQYHTFEDGSAIMMFEMLKIWSHTYTTPNGTGTVTNYRHGDIIVAKVSIDGNFEWIKMIPKLQVSTNTRGDYSSFNGFFQDGEFVMFFNDNINNYNVSGDFEILNNVYQEVDTDNKKKLCTVKLVVDFTNGKTIRSKFIDPTVADLYCVPGAFQINNAKGVIKLIFQAGGLSEKGKIGTVKI